MRDTESHTAAIYRHRFTVSHDVVDGNGHVNNVAYVQWMQDVAILHSDAAGGARATKAAGATWVARSHKIEYLSPAFPGDSIEALTWVVNFRRARSLRRYRFVRTSDGRLLARGETEWVFVDAASGRPRAIPGTVAQAFELCPEGQEP
ncbi:MAG: acyl-CoA thioesterase [Candidatus Sumerlaeota bacterium]|nr:acyl-CoA thioesterase [Candidatus Sumerlaeota bacterium]